MSATKHKMGDLIKSRKNGQGPPICPIMDNRSQSKATNDPVKTFNLALAYALSVGRQEDVAQACKVSQGTVSRWCAGHIPKPKNLAPTTHRLSGFINRRSRKVVA